jgi:hypothetical protein
VSDEIAKAARSVTLHSDRRQRDEAHRFYEGNRSAYKSLKQALRSRLYAPLVPRKVAAQPPGERFFTPLVLKRDRVKRRIINS